MDGTFGHLTVEGTRTTVGTMKTAGSQSGHGSPATVLRYGGHTWSRLLDEDPRDVALGLDRPETERFLCWDGETDVLGAVLKRWRRDLAGEAMTLVIRRRGAVVGWAGLLVSDTVPAILQTSTFLHPKVWGTGLNVLAKHVQWSMVDLLGRSSMLLEIAGDNARSQSAAWKLFPSARVRQLASPDEPEASLVMEVDQAPDAPDPLTSAQRRTLERMLRRHTGWRIWRLEG
jgi:hypothetical protein